MTWSLLFFLKIFAKAKRNELKKTLKEMLFSQEYEYFNEPFWKDSLGNRENKNKIVKYFKVEPEEQLKLKDSIMLSNEKWNLLRRSLDLKEFLLSEKDLGCVQKSIDCKLQERLQIMEFDEKGIKGIQVPLTNCIREITQLRDISEKKFKLSLDARTFGNRTQTLAGVIPLSCRRKKIQSYKSVFPLVLYDEKEDNPIIRDIECNVERELLALKEEGYCFYVAADLKTLWNLCKRTYKPSSVHQVDVGEDTMIFKSASSNLFCPFCNQRQDQMNELSASINAETRFFGLTAHETIFCWLHCKLRITGKLIQNICWKAHDSNKLKEFEAMMKEIGWKKFKAKKRKNGSFKIPSIDGSTLKKIMKHIETIDTWLRNNFCGPSSILMFWKELTGLLDTLDDLSDSEIDHIKVKIGKFSEEYLKAFGHKYWTPYLHIFCCHTIEILQKHRNLAKFSQQGFEAVHNLHKKMYFLGTSHDGGKQKIPSIVQIFYKHWRILALDDKGKFNEESENISNEVEIFENIEETLLNMEYSTDSGIL